MGGEGSLLEMSCPNCGSWAVKADRSLGGRMVCGRCGQPLGAKVIPLKRRRRSLSPFRLRLPAARRLWWLALLALLGVSGVLAALEPGGEGDRFLPRQRSPLSPRERFS